MVCGEARKLGGARVYKKDGRRWQSPIFDICPDIKRSSQNILRPWQNRPYINYARSTPTRWVWNTYSPTPARFAIGKRAPTGLVLIEPSIKQRAPPGKQWGRWQELVNAMPHVPWVQIGNGPRLGGVKHVRTPTIIEAMHVISGCRLCVVPEGGLHHIAAALGIPAVVLFGGYITPAITGYATQRNIFVDDPEAQGWRIPHPALDRCWQRITVGMVAQAVEEALIEGA